MQHYTPTPDYYNDYICHFNKNHDPKNGQFTFGSGGSAGSVKKKEPKSRKIWSYAMLEKDLKTGRRELTKEEYDKLKINAISPYTESIPGLAEWILENDPDFENIDPLNPQKTAEKYREDMLKKSNADFDGETVKSSKKKVNTSVNENIKNVDSTTVTRDGSWLNGDFKNGKKGLSVYGVDDQYSNVKEQNIKDTAKKVLQSQAEIKKLAIESMKDDNLYERWYKQMPWGKDGKLSETEFYNKLDLDGVYVNDNKGNVEISFWSDDNSLLGGHSVDIEFDLNNLKKSRYVSVQG